MTNLTYSGDSNFKSEDNIKNNLLKILIFYSVLSFIFLLLFSFSGVRLFNSLNLSMTVVSGGGFLPSDNLNDIISNNLQKFVLLITLILSVLNFYLLFNIFNRKIYLKNIKRTLIYLYLL